MTKDELHDKINSMPSYIPIVKIEKDIGMPRTTLQKSLKDERKKLPKKWVKPFINYIETQNKNL